VNPPDAGTRAGNKLTGLRAAARAGLAVPETLVTTDPDEAAAFLDRHGGRVVAKALHSHYVELDGRRHSLFTRRVTAADRAALTALRAAPCMLQPEVSRRTEIRVTVVGDRVLAAERDLRGIDEVDVRRVARRLPVRACELAADVAARCVALVAGLGLRYAALDVARTPDDEHVVLDLNPRGGWWSVEERTGLPISDAVAGLLAGTP
jgi:glutathione synthase/RimK-type ligase-like ATP-grasp enzyme